MGLAPSTPVVLAGAVLIGLGVGCLAPTYMNWLGASSTRQNSGKHMGAFATACNLGQFSCSLLSGVVLAAFGTHQAVFFVAAGIGAIAAVGVIVRRAFQRA